MFTMSSSPDASPKDGTTETNDEHLLVNGEGGGESEQLSENSIADELETLSLSGDTLDQFTCHVCESEYKQPRVLTCLHVFCEECLKPLLEEDCIICPTCSVVWNFCDIIVIAWWLVCQSTFFPLGFVENEGLGLLLVLGLIPTNAGDACLFVRMSNILRQDVRADRNNMLLVDHSLSLWWNTYVF